MRFTIVYQGDLPPNGNKLVKWNIRRAIEPQIRRLWEIAPLDDLAKFKDPDYLPNDCYVGRSVNDIEFLPLISTTLKLRAEIYLKILSAEGPGGLVNCGDIDNRLKTLLDALSAPSPQQIPQSPDLHDDRRLFCLLEDDKLITKIDISNDRLLTEPNHSKKTIVIIEVHPIAFRVTFANIGIAI